MEWGLEMVHELKNQLTAVKVLVQLGQRNPAESASHARLAAIEKEIARMQDLVSRYASAAESIRHCGSAAA